MNDVPTVLRIAADLWRAEREASMGSKRRRQARLDALVAHTRTASRTYTTRRSRRSRDPHGPPPDPQTRGDGTLRCLADRSPDPPGRRRGVPCRPCERGRALLGPVLRVPELGTTGQPGVFVADPQAIAVANAAYLRHAASLARQAHVGRIAAIGFRQARVVGPRPFAGAGMVALNRPRCARRSPRIEILDPGRPVAEVVAQLCSIDSEIIEGYPSALQLLASEQRAERPALRPGLVATGGESVSVDELRDLAAVLGAPMVDGYASSECLILAGACEHEWLHSRSDGMILDPVDAEFRPVPSGQVSHTVLLTNLSNHVQPMVRHDLGGSVRMRPEPCRVTLPSSWPRW